MLALAGVVMNHTIEVECPNCGEAYDAHLHWFVCPRCGMDAAMLADAELESERIKKSVTPEPREKTNFALNKD